MTLALALATLVLQSPSAQAQTYTVIHAFTGGTDGQYPYAGLTLDSAGNQYGVTQGGGTFGYGTVFEFNTSGQESVLFNFRGPAQKGGDPDGVLFRDAAGTLYGTTVYGGILLSAGTVFAISSSGGTRQWRNLPGEPFAGVIADPHGNLYGTTYASVFEVRNNSVKVLHNFTGTPDGTDCQASLHRDAAGNLYGTTLFGGLFNAGTVFKIDTAGNETVLYSFTGGADGGHPSGSLIEDVAGNLYSTTGNGGTYAQGTVFKLDTNGNETVLYSFAGGTDGLAPIAGLTNDPEGNFYGTTLGGGSGFGTVFKLDITGKETVLYRFTGGKDGGSPYAGVVRDQHGNLYGTAYVGGDFGCYKFGCGVVYRVKP